MLPHCQMHRMPAVLRFELPLHAGEECFHRALANAQGCAIVHIFADGIIAQHGKFARR